MQPLGILNSFRKASGTSRNPNKGIRIITLSSPDIPVYDLFDLSRNMFEDKIALEEVLVEQFPLLAKAFLTWDGQVDLLIVNVGILDLTILI